MRISTAYAYSRSQEEILDRQVALAKAQDQLTTGLRVQTPSDDPFAAAQAERSRSVQVHIDMQRRAGAFAQSMLGSLEGALANAGSVLQDVRDTILSAGNAIQTMGERGAIATQLKQMRSELLGVANRSDGSGGYLFGGQGSRTPPFVDGPTVQFQGQSGQQTIGTGVAAETSIDGAAVFTNVATSTGRMNVFSTIDAAISLLENPAASSASLATSLSTLVAQVDNGLDSTLISRTKIGERLSQLDSYQSQLDDAELSAKSYSSQITEVDMAKAISEVNAQQLNLQASMKTYVQVSGISLFNFIR